MAFKIEDGTGKGFTQRVNANNRAFVNAIQVTEQDSATIIGNAYNVNTGDIWLSSGANASAVAYLKNNEDQDLIINSIAVGMGGNSGLATNATPEIVLVRNPTGGGIVGSANPVTMNQNRTFSSSKTLTADAYLGGNAYTMTGGSDIAQFYQTTNGRLFANIGFVLGKGDSIGLKIQPNLTAGSFTCYAAWICHLRDADEI